ncbi:hypothetical protein AB6F62_12960 [Providencia huaxiensis]|uniref:Uncharacterized protein n=1 Tax=Providencia huashanensis TaxID=3037798 RepID=A0AA42K1Q2_9GAMM|nr:MULTISPECIES: hypothetical protein [Providencia]APC13917.1 hypothetical protein RB151_042900 [Providencia rettgeri]MCY0803540.1 hypothetical protein [Providencia rettgeri]MDG4698959.1 hypothetical protein [Providencia sp. CRE-3FA-0001]MDH2325153.1 hypothetical protein [Providencia rettgeri]MDK3010114.1 hypothetical protein [Providencia rettgeri]
MAAVDVLILKELKKQQKCKKRTKYKQMNKKLNFFVATCAHSS